MNNDNDDFFLLIWNPILCMWIVMCVLFLCD